MHQTLIVKKKEGKLASQSKLNKLKKEARLEGNNDDKIFTEYNNEWLKVLETWKQFKEEKMKIIENETLVRHSDEFTEVNEKEREKKEKVFLGTKKNINRDRVFKYANQNASKGKRLGLRNSQDVD